MAKLKTIEPEVYPQEVLADEEPKYLRRQKPLEIKRRKFGRKAWKAYLQTGAWVVAGFVGVWCVWESSTFLLNARQMALIHPEQVRINGAHFVPRDSILEIFAADRERSVLRIPLSERRRQIESVPWVEQAVVRRALPNSIEVEITERTPIAFLREGNDMALIDAHGVILNRPLEGNFHFPVVTGLSPDMPTDDREKRMQLFAGFTQQVASARAGALEQVSEVDLTDASDVKATITGLQGMGASSPTGGSFSDAPAWGQSADAPILVHFGYNDFEGKYNTLIENIGAWRATTGRVESVDLRFSREAIVNPEATPGGTKHDGVRVPPGELAVHHPKAKHQGA